jgi:Amt family ammonium transporter
MPPLRTSVFVLAALACEPSFASDGTDAAMTVLVGVSAALVFFMQTGFAMLESGMVRAKNTVNVILKNVADVSVGTIGFWLLGFGLMFGANPSGWLGTDGFAPGPDDIDAMGFVYQVMFAATAATIVSGAVAERMRFWVYLVVSVLITMLLYPLIQFLHQPAKYRAGRVELRLVFGSTGCS